MSPVKRVTDLQELDPFLFRSLSKLQLLADEKQRIMQCEFLSPEEKEQQVQTLTIDVRTVL